MTHPTEIKEKKISKDGYHHGDLRAALVEATRKLVEEKGPDQFSVADACRAAGVSTAAPYRHFPDKHAMLVAVATDGMSRLADRAAAEAENHKPGSVDAIAAIGEVYVRFAMAEPAVFRLMFGLTNDHSEFPDLMEAGRRCFGVLLGQMSVRLGVPPDHPTTRTRSFALWTFVHGLSFLLIDEKAARMQIDIDLPSWLHENTRRLLSD